MAAFCVSVCGSFQNAPYRLIVDLESSENRRQINHEHTVHLSENVSLFGNNPDHCFEIVLILLTSLLFISQFIAYVLYLLCKDIHT